MGRSRGEDKIVQEQEIIAAEERCVICQNPRAPIVWFGGLHFCYYDNEDFTKRYLETVLATQLVDVIPHPPTVKRKWIHGDEQETVHDQRDKSDSQGSQSVQEGVHSREDIQT